MDLICLILTKSLCRCERSSCLVCTRVCEFFPLVSKQSSPSKTVIPSKHTSSRTALSSTSQNKHTVPEDQRQALLMNIPLRTSFLRTITPQAASPNSSTPFVNAATKSRKRHADDQDTFQLFIAENPEPDEITRAEALLAPGCGRTVCRNCSFENTSTSVFPLFHIPYRLIQRLRHAPTCFDCLTRM